MFDLVLRGGEVVDGTGAPRRRADVALRDGRIAAIGEFGVGALDEGARRVVDVDGLVVAPGFVDIHTHYDAQLLWDPVASPSPLHGVTTVLAGNCGFSIAPMAPEHVDYIMRMMARVEGMSLNSLHVGPEWDWRSFGDYLARFEGRLGVNAGFLVGHSTIRRLAMGDDAVGGTPTAAQLDTMVQLVHEALSSGALGLSSTLGEAEVDGDGEPVPSRSAGAAEFLALAGALHDHAGTTLEFLPAMGEISAERIELMADMSLAANRPLNWNLLGSFSATEIYEQQLTASDRATEKGARVVALTLPDFLRVRASTVIEDLPGWRQVVALEPEARRKAITDPEVRRQMHEGVEIARSRGLDGMLNWGLIEVAETVDPLDEGLAGRTIADIAAERGADPVDVLIDVVVPDRLPLTTLFPSLVPSLGTSDEGWRVRAKVWQDDRTVLGGSDAGAHLDLMCHANYTTQVLGDSVRERRLLSLEEAVRQFTDVPARLYGLADRGRVAVGCCADLVVFDPARVGSEPAYARTDMPGQGLRLYAEGRGIAHVFVNGSEIITDDRFTGDLGGTLLRSGRDTTTVTVPGGR